MVDMREDENFETSLSADSDSDESYHSLTEQLQNITVDQSLSSVNAADSFEFYGRKQCSSGHDADGNHLIDPRNIQTTSPASSDVQFRPEDSENSSKVSQDTLCSSFLSNNSPDSKKDGTSVKTHVLDDFSRSTAESFSDASDVLSQGVLGPDAVVNCPADDGLGEEDEEEFDIYCLVAVKNKDDELELKLKDKMDISVEEIKTALDAAVEEKREGNVLFSGSKYSEAITRHDLYPDARYKTSSVWQDEHKLAVHSLTQALVHDPRYIKALARRAAEHEAIENLDEALQDYQRLLELQPSNREAREAVHRLPPKITERNEKLKAEMMGKLKDLGNMILKPFGMSTDNFQLQQDPNSGGYNIKFNQNQ
ncbi:Tetratricopeptide-like helical domain [Trinorchestia longiramus]|nr:Tetratricopeptide-like helical domain [Trinorchestia longiramus]